MRAGARPRHRGAAGRRLRRRRRRPGEILEHVADLPRGSPRRAGCCGPAACWCSTPWRHGAGRLRRGHGSAERLPGGPPPGIHDPALFVDRDGAAPRAARHGVDLRLRGHPPVVRDARRWLARPRRLGPDDADPHHRRPLRRGRRKPAGRRVVEPVHNGNRQPWPRGAYVTGRGHRAARATLRAGRRLGRLLRRALRRRPRGRRGSSPAPACASRHAVVNPLDEDVVRAGRPAPACTATCTEALPLGKDAVGGALDAAGLRAEDVGLFAVASCTGYATPGLDIRLAADLGMAAGAAAAARRPHGLLRRDPRPRRGRRLRGQPAAARPCCCAASSPGCTCSRPPTTSSRSSRTPCSPTPPRPWSWWTRAPAHGRRCGWSTSPRVPTRRTADHMTWDVTDLGFRMGLSPAVPRVLARHVRGLVADLLARARHRDRRRRRLGRAPGRAAHPRRRRATELELPPGDARRLAGGARRARQLLVGDGAAGARRAALGRPATTGRASASCWRSGPA